VLDASALVALFHGNPAMLSMLDDAEVGSVFLLLPTVAIAEAESVVGAGSQLWEPFLLYRGVRSLDLTEHTAIEAGQLMTGTPLMVAQVVYEAQALNAVVVTRNGDVYGSQDVAVMVV
jgi:hypothetical protein